MRHMVVVYMNNQQAAIVLGEKISREHDVTVDILTRNEICTIHPPTKPDILEDIPVVAPRGWADQAIKEIQG